MPDADQLAIAICTHNGSAHLAQSLGALVKPAQAAQINVFVIDSGSTADEARKIRELAQTLDMDCVRLEEPGLSKARNAALDRCRARWIAYVDDDAVIFPDWVDRTLARISSAKHNLAAIAGRVVARWPDRLPKDSVPPAAIGPRWMVFLSVLDNQATYPSTSNPTGVGANIMFRRDALEQVGGFPLNLGRVGKSLASGEERFVLNQLVKAGFATLFDGSIAVEHIIRPERLTYSWISKRSRKEGELNFYMDARSSARRAAKLAKCALTLGPLWATTCLGLSTEAWVRMHHNLGYLSGAFSRGISRRQVQT